jgi:hypothetical protein
MNHSSGTWRLFLRWGLLRKRLRSGLFKSDWLGFRFRFRFRFRFGFRFRFRFRFGFGWRRHQLKLNPLFYLCLRGSVRKYKLYCK